MKRRSILRRLIFVLLFSVSIVGTMMIHPAQAIIVVDDHFDDGVLDPAWLINFQGATGWTYSESGTNLTVTDIAPAVVNSGNSQSWARVILSHSFTPLTDFHVKFDFSWDSGGNVRAMQVLDISLYDPDDHFVAACAYYDAWISKAGQKYAEMEDDYLLGSSLKHAGTASIDISRLGSNTTISWNGSTLFSGVTSDPISKVLLTFMYYPYRGISYFGTLPVDLVRIEGTPIYKEITIDIKPGSNRNSINPKSKGKIPVAILSTEDFDAPNMTDQDSLTFGPQGDEDSLAFCNPNGEDLNEDGLIDLVCHFYTQLTGFGCDDVEGILMGNTTDYIPIVGKDSVKIKRCK
jgi:hypothetical protein